MSKAFGLEQVEVGLSGFYARFREEIIVHLRDLRAGRDSVVSGFIVDGSILAFSRVNSDVHDEHLILGSLQQLRASAPELSEASLFERSEYEHRALALFVRLRELAR